MSGKPPDETATGKPKGRPADQRLFEAIENLCTQFSVCGLKQPVAIHVEPGQAKMIEAAVRGSVHMLFDDARCTELRIWGVPIRESVRDE